MSSRGKKTVSFLRVSPLFEQNCNCGQGFRKRFGPRKTDSERHGGPTTEVPRRQISAQELDHRKQVKNEVVGIPRKYLEAKARILAGKGE